MPKPLSPEPNFSLFSSPKAALPVVLCALAACTQTTPSAPRAASGPQARPRSFLAPPGPIRFTFTNNTLGPARNLEAFVTVIGRDTAGRYCHLDAQGRFLPCDPRDQTVARNGRTWAIYGLPFKDATRIELEPSLRIDSGRAYLSVGGPTYLRLDPATGGLVEPDPTNPSDPNGTLIYDWIEFALDGTGFHGNTTCVDQFGLPVTLTATGRSQPGQPLGPVGLAETRTELLRAWKAAVPVAFQDLAVPGGQRILAPAHGPQYATGACKDYFQAYLAQTWSRYAREPLVLTPEEGTFTGQVGADGRLVFTRAGDPVPYVIARMPTTTEVFLCSGVLAQGNGLEKVLGAQLAALLNRHVADPQAWKVAAGYYQASPCNHYARFWHQHALGGKAYGFPYDDVNDQSPSLAVPDPLEIRVTCRWD